MDTPLLFSSLLFSRLTSVDRPLHEIKHKKAAHVAGAPPKPKPILEVLVFWEEFVESEESIVGLNEIIISTESKQPRMQRTEKAAPPAAVEKLTTNESRSWASGNRSTRWASPRILTRHFKTRQHRGCDLMVRGTRILSTFWLLRNQNRQFWHSTLPNRTIVDEPPAAHFENWTEALAQIVYSSFLDCPVLSTTL
jgi:hypothetical protein